MADQISVLHQGTIVANGNANFIKARFNLGYKLVVQSDKKHSAITDFIKGNLTHG